MFSLSAVQQKVIMEKRSVLQVGKLQNFHFLSMQEEKSLKIVFSTSMPVYTDVQKNWKREADAVQSTDTQR